MNTTKSDNYNEKGLGAVLNPHDPRDVELAKVQAPVAVPSKYKTGISRLAVEDQEKLGSCVGQAEGKLLEYFDYKETKKLRRNSKRFIYARCKAQDGNPGEGTYPRVAAKVLMEEGAASADLVPNDNDLSHAEYIDVKVTDAIKKDAKPYRVKGYAVVPPIAADIKQAIYQNGVVSATLETGDWSDSPVKPTPSRGRHRILLYGYEDTTRNGVADTKIYFRNSWGKKWGDSGNGYFYFNDYARYIYDIMVYTDLPNDLVEELKETQYLFTRDLERGDTGADVMELQKRLAKEMAVDGLPCFRDGEFDQVFGPLTQAAVQRYQTVKGIVLYGTPSSTGYGRLGPKTRASLNGAIPGPGPEERPKLYKKVASLRDTLVNVMAAIGQPIVVTDEYRTYAEQDDLYAIGRTKPGTIVTNARGGESLHNFRVAFDVAFKKGSGITYEGNWSVLGAVGKALGLEWGGDWTSFPDRPHFQFTAGYSLAEFQKGTIDLTKFGEEAGEEAAKESQLPINNNPSSMSFLHRVKSFLINAASLVGTGLITALVAALTSPEGAAAIGAWITDVPGLLIGLGVGAPFAVVIGLVIAELWKQWLNAHKIAKATREGAVTAAYRAKDIELY